MQKGLPVVSAACAAALSLAAAGAQAAAPAREQIRRRAGGLQHHPPLAVVRDPAHDGGDQAGGLDAQACEEHEPRGRLQTRSWSARSRSRSSRSTASRPSSGRLLDSPIPTEVDLKIVSGKYTTATLAADAQGFAESLSGAKVGGITRLTSARAAASSSRERSQTAAVVTTGLEFYFFAHKNRLYILSFELGDSFLHQARIAAVLRSIADDFSFSV